MNNEILTKLYAISEQRLKDTPMNFRRYLHPRIGWNQRLLFIRGSRGVGKTTLLLQHMKDMGLGSDKSLYVSLDNVWLGTRELYDLIEYYVHHGGTHLFFDEVHYFDKWQTLFKNVNDDFKGLQVVFTGSSLLRIEKSAGDLSRRLATCDLSGMSFREFLSFEGVCDIPAVSLGEVLSNHVEIARGICEKAGAVLGHFDRYLKFGYYPFYRDAGEYFETMLRQSMNQVLDSDYPKIEDVEPPTIHKARRMMKILAERTPQTPNVTALCRELEVDRRQGVKMLYSLERAGLLQLLSSDRENLKNLSTPDKIFCGDTAIMHTLSANPDVGTLRETFFLNQVKVVAPVSYPLQGDFLVDDRYLFEVGGRGKGFDQIKDLPDSYVAADGLEVGFGNKIPLWLFGFLY